MELLEGKSLEELASARGGRLPVMEVLKVMREVLDALAAAHEHGVVHRDIKPENIFITVDGRVKVLDFGIAHLPDGFGPPSPKTQSGLIMGTPAFMSPEQARARWDLVGPVSDVWSVGATMFTLLSGEFVHDEDTVPEILSAIFTRPARSLKVVMPNAALPVVALVDRALQRRTADRWGSAREMRLALLEVEAALGERSRRPPRSSLATTLPQVGKWPIPRRSAALGALDLMMGLLFLVLSIRCLDAGASTAEPFSDPMVATLDTPTIAGPELASPIAIEPIVRGRAVPHGVVAQPVAPPATATSHGDGVNGHRSIYDRRN
jgi:serine/threonine-protein kinase